MPNKRRMNFAAYKFYKPEYLESLIGDDAETKAIVLSTLLEDVPADFLTMEKHLSEKDWHNFHLVSHKLKSTLAFIGDEDISENNNEMMLLARNNTELNKIPRLLTEAKERWLIIQPEIKFALSQLSD